MTDAADELLKQLLATPAGRAKVQRALAKKKAKKGPGRPRGARTRAETPNIKWARAILEQNRPGESLWATARRLTDAAGGKTDDVRTRLNAAKFHLPRLAAEEEVAWLAAAFDPSGPVLFDRVVDAVLERTGGMPMEAALSLLGDSKHGPETILAAVFDNEHRLRVLSRAFQWQGSQPTDALQLRARTIIRGLQYIWLADEATR